jgi:hypothetical protein
MRQKSYYNLWTTSLRRDNMGNRRYERPEVKQITRQWVRENCHNVTERDLGLLRLLNEKKRRLLRRDQIQALYPEFPSTDFLNKRLNILYRMHVIDKVYPPVGIGKGSSKQHICIDRAGAILLDIDKHNKIIQTDSMGNKTLPLGWEHKVMINDYEIALRNYQVIKYDVEEHHPFGDNILIPDIFCLIKHEGKGYLFFIEVDLGTEDIPYVKRKLDSYSQYYMSKAWTRKDWAKIFKTPVFPRVLFLTENGRTKRKKTLEEYTRDSGIRYVVGFHNELGDILDSIIKG